MYIPSMNTSIYMFRLYLLVITTIKYQICNILYIDNRPCCNTAWKFRRKNCFQGLRVYLHQLMCEQDTYTYNNVLTCFFKCINNLMSSVFALYSCEIRLNVCQVSKINRLLLRFLHNLVVKIKNMRSSYIFTYAYL